MVQKESMIVIEPVPPMPAVGFLYYEKKMLLLPSVGDLKTDAYINYKTQF